MTANISRKEKKIIKTVNTEINDVQNEIRHACIKFCGISNIGIAIELLCHGQGDIRPKPCNKICEKIISDLTKRELCDESDKIMKQLLQDEIITKQQSSFSTKQQSSFSIGYQCHKGLSNVIVPFDGDACKWYIFLGQFCLKKGSDYKSIELDELLLVKENIKILGSNGVQLSSSNAVKNGLFFDGKENEFKNVPQLTVPELLKCKVVALTIWWRTLEKWRNTKGKMKEFLEEYIKIFREGKQEDQSDARKVKPRVTAAFET